MEDVGVLEQVLVYWFLWFSLLFLFVKERILEASATMVPASATSEWTSAHVEVELPATAAATSATSSAEGIATTEELIEKVVHVHVGARTPAGLLVPDSLFATHIVGSALLRILQGLIRQSYFLELLFCSLRIVLILIRMVLDRQFLEALLNLCLICISRHAQDLVVVLRRLFLLSRASAPAASASEMASAATSAAKAAKLRRHEERWVAPRRQRWIYQIIAELTRVSRQIEQNGQ